MLVLPSALALAAALLMGQSQAPLMLRPLAPQLVLALHCDSQYRGELDPAVVLGRQSVMLGPQGSEGGGLGCEC